jgi:polyisoprenoid-binding protein YceI
LKLLERELTWQLTCEPSMIRSVIVVVACGLVIAAPAFAQRRGIDVERSTLTVRVFKAGLFRAFADNHTIQAPIAEGSLDDSAAPSVQLAIDAKRMKVLDPGLSPKDREDVQTRMLGPDVLDTSRFAQIRFRSTAVQRQDGNRWLVRGDLELHGQTHPIALNVALESGHYKGSATLRQSDFAITPISIAGGTVKVKDQVTIEFDIATAQ